MYRAESWTIFDKHAKQNNIIRDQISQENNGKRKREVALEMTRSDEIWE